MELKHVRVYAGGEAGSLLIVPYGIETSLPTFVYTLIKLLIVPYGIETLEASPALPAAPPFNRTLWN